MNLLDQLRTRRLLAIVRGTDAEASLRTVLTLAEAGIPLVEVSLTTADATGVIARARAELGDGATLGAGTVLSGRDARRAADAGASFIVTPGLGPGAAEGRGLGLPVLAGALTPTEVVQAAEVGEAVKLFPAELGGSAYLRALRAPFPDVPFVPVGGVGIDEARAFLQAGAVAVGVGSPLVGDAADGGDLSALRDRAATYLRMVEEEAGR